MQKKIKKKQQHQQQQQHQEQSHDYNSDLRISSPNALTPALCGTFVQC
jgi:hypothetical protein